MFRSGRRAVVYPQAEHARLAAALAAAWGNDRFPRPPLPHDSFVRGVALHDRGYGELDDDAIGEVGPQRWVEIQRRSFAPRGEDAVVDLVAALHVRRLVSARRNELERAAHEEMDAVLPSLLAAAGVAETDALVADRVTAVCDRVSFAYCCEEPDEGVAEVPGGAVAWSVDGAGRIALDPWPLGVPRLTGVVTAYRAEGYPRRLDPVVEAFRAEQAPRGGP